MSETIANVLAAVVNPTPEQFNAQEEWFERHPVLVGVLFVGCITGVIPALVLGWLS